MSETLSFRRYLPRFLGGISPNGAKALTSMRHDGRRVLTELLLPQTKIDYANEVGDGLGSSVLAAPLNFLMRTFPEAPPIVERRKRGQWEEEPDHELAMLLENPNPFYSGRTLSMVTALDVSFGEAFWLKIRNKLDQVIQLWWVPRAMIEPKWPNDGSAFISHYEYTVNGQKTKIETRDVVHIRFGLDPRDPRRGLSQLGALMREIAVDDHAANFTASILKNLGIIGVVIAPKEKGTAKQEDVDAVKSYIKQAFTGDKRAEPLALGAPTDVHLLQYNLQGFDVSPIRDVSEERICAALGIPAAVVGFGTGLHQTKVGAPQPLSARLWTPSGPTTMGEMEPGRTVAIPGGWGRVKNVYPQGVQDIYRITFQDGSTAESTIDHLWEVATPNQGRRVLPLSEVAKMPQWKLRRTALPLQGVTEFDEQPTLIPPYVMGLLLADGSFRENLFFSNANTEIVARVTEEVAAGYDVTRTSQYDYRIAYRDHARGKGKGGGSGNISPFKDEIRRLGLWMLYSHEKFIPDLYKYNSSSVRRELLRGLLDGDGFVNHHGQPAIEQTSARLAADVTWMVQSLGGYTLQSFKRADKRERKINGRAMRSRHDRYHLSIVINDAASLFYCAEKAERCRDRKKPATRKFRSIEFARQEAAQCIEVDGGLYLTDNFIVTHNTMKEMRQLAWTGGIIPMQETISDEVNRSLLPEFENGKRQKARVRFDTSKVRALWEDNNEKHQRVREDFKAKLIDRAEARRETGRTVRPEDENVYFAGAPEKDPNPTNPAPAAPASQEEEDVEDQD